MAVVAAVHRSSTWSMPKEDAERIELVADHGVAGDVHAGDTVRHRPLAAVDPSRPNDRQVHLVAAEAYEGLQRAGFDVAPGGLGENVTTRGVDLLALTEGTRIRLGAAAEVRLTGTRHPRPAGGEPPTALTIGADGIPSGPVGVFGVVTAGGLVAPGDPVTVRPGTPEPLRPL